MELIKLVFVAIIILFLSKYTQKLVKRLWENTTKQLAKLWDMVKAVLNNTFVTLKPSQQEPFPNDFEAAIKEMEAIVNQNPDLKQDIIDLVAEIKEEHSTKIQNIKDKVDKNKLQSAAIHLNKIALSYESQEEYEKAETLYLEAIEIDKIALPENDPLLATHLSDLAVLYESQEKYEEAKSLLLQALEINKTVLPKNHPNIAVSLQILARLYESQEKHKTAEHLYLQAIEILKQSLGKEHPNTQTVIKNYQIFLNEKNNEKNE